MKFIRNNWFYLGMVFFACLSFGAVLWGRELDAVQTVLLFSLMALPLHQFEEYAFPGGGPVVINRVFHGEQELYRRYPGNWNSVMIVNLSAYVFYILALALPNLTWLGIATMLFNAYQVLGHGVQMNVKMKTWYNPGMATSLLLFLPISAWYFFLVASQGLASGADWALGALGFVAIAALTVVLPVQGLKRKDSPYDVPQWQVDQLEKVRAFAQIGAKRG